MPVTAAPATDPLGTPMAAPPAASGALGTPAPAPAPAPIAPMGGTVGGGTTASAPPNLAALASIHAALHAATAPAPTSAPSTLTAAAGSLPVPTSPPVAAPAAPAPVSAVQSALTASLAPAAHQGGTVNATPAQATALAGQNLPSKTSPGVAGAQPLAQGAVNAIGNRDLVNYGTTGTTNPFIAAHNASQQDAKQMLTILATQGSAAAQAYANGLAQNKASQTAAVQGALSAATLTHAAPGEANNVSSMAALPGNLFSNYLTQGAASQAAENKAQTSAYNQYGQEVSQAVPVIQAQTQAGVQAYQNKAEAGLAAAVQAAALKAQQEQATIQGDQINLQSKEVALSTAEQNNATNKTVDAYKVTQAQTALNAEQVKALAAGTITPGQLPTSAGPVQPDYIIPTTAATTKAGTAGYNVTQSLALGIQKDALAGTSVTQTVNNAIANAASLGITTTGTGADAKAVHAAILAAVSQYYGSSTGGATTPAQLAAGSQNRLDQAAAALTNNAGNPALP